MLSVLAQLLFALLSLSVEPEEEDGDEDDEDEEEEEVVVEYAGVVDGLDVGGGVGREGFGRRGIGGPACSG